MKILFTDWLFFWISWTYTPNPLVYILYLVCSSTDIIAEMSLIRYSQWVICNHCQLSSTQKEIPTKMYRIFTERVLTYSSAGESHKNQGHSYHLCYSKVLRLPMKAQKLLFCMQLKLYKSFPSILFKIKEINKYGKNEALLTLNLMNLNKTY